jgi:hypothetical protein
MGIVQSLPTLDLLIQVEYPSSNDCEPCEHNSESSIDFPCDPCNYAIIFHKE